MIERTTVGAVAREDRYTVACRFVAIATTIKVVCSQENF